MGIRLNTTPLSAFVNMIKTKIYHLMFFAFLFPLFASAQPKDISKLDWVAMGVGIGDSKNMSTFINYTFVDDNCYQLNINSNFDFSVFGTSECFYTGSFSYGITDYSKKFFGGVFLGPSLAYSERNGTSNKFAIGINFNIQYFYALEDVMGLGIDAFYNVNTINSICGIRFSIFLKSIK